ncbi:hypothetical protein BDV93DRAFT_515783, partial [Ceratobasidium sp. AG-I]
ALGASDSRIIVLRLVRVLFCAQAGCAKSHSNEGLFRNCKSNYGASTGSESVVSTRSPHNYAARRTTFLKIATFCVLLGTDEDNSYLCSWTRPSNALSLKSFSMNSTTFRPAIPVGQHGSPWEYPVSDQGSAVDLGSDASSEDWHMRSHTEVRKVKRAMMVRKLIAALAAIRLVSS